jgi:hypothetical protein
MAGNGYVRGHEPKATGRAIDLDTIIGTSAGGDLMSDSHPWNPGIHQNPRFVQDLLYSSYNEMMPAGTNGATNWLFLQGRKVTVRNSA